MLTNGVDILASEQTLKLRPAARSTGRTSLSAVSASSEQILKVREVSVCVVHLHVHLCERERREAWLEKVGSGRNTPGYHITTPNGHTRSCSGREHERLGTGSAAAAGRD